MSKNRTLFILVLVLLAAAFLREARLLDYPFFGDESQNNDIALEILDGNIAPFYPHSHGREALYDYTTAISVALLGDNVLSNRLPSVWWSMLLVALMYAYGRRLFNSRRVGVLAAGLTAALWWPAVFAHVGLRAVAMPVVCIPALLELITALHAPAEKRARKAGWLGGFFAGLTAYTYTSGRGFPAVVLLFILYAAVFHRHRVRQRWRVLGLYLLVMALTSVWLYAYLGQHPTYDERIGMVQEGIDMFLRGDLDTTLKAIAETAGMFTVRGEPVWLYNISERPVFVGPEGGLFYLGLLLCLWRLRRPEYALQLIVLGVMMLPSLLTEHPPSWTRSIGMLPGLLIITVVPVELGWRELEQRLARLAKETRSRWQSMGLPVYAILVVALGLSIFCRTSHDMLKDWMEAPGVYWMTLAYYHETAEYINTSSQTKPLTFNMPVVVPWRQRNLTRAINRDEVKLRLSINNALVFPNHPDGLRVAFQIYEPPALALQETFLNLDRPLYMGPRVDPAGKHILYVYDVPHSTFAFHLAQAQANPVFTPHSNTLVTEPVQFGGLLQFQGYEILNLAAQAGQTLQVLTYWQVLDRPPELAVFLHLLDSDGEIVAQYDGFNVSVDELEATDTVVQLHSLSLPADLSGRYQLQLGVYTRPDLQRLPTSIQAPDDILWLQPWQPLPGS